MFCNSNRGQILKQINFVYSGTKIIFKPKFFNPGFNLFVIKFIFEKLLSCCIINTIIILFSVLLLKRDRIKRDQ
jgi:hypothetical protein